MKLFFLNSKILHRTLAVLCWTAAPSLAAQVRAAESHPDDIASRGTNAPMDAVSLMSPKQWRPWDSNAAAAPHGAAATPSFPWRVEQGEFMAGSAAPRIITTNYFSQYILHLDFLIPSDGGDFNRSNRDVGGVLLNGKYEIQLADSHGQPAGSNSLGAVIGHNAPLTNAAAPAGSWQSMEIAFAQNQDESAKISVWVNDALVQDRVIIESSAPGNQGQSDHRSEPLFVADPSLNPSIDFGAGFTLSARFRTRQGGTLAAKSFPDREWIPGGKALFVREGRVVFDIGWVGAMQGRSRVNDGQWHTATVTSSDGVARLYLDGELEAERARFSAPDPEEAVFAIGTASLNFPQAGSFSGDIDGVKFWPQAFTGERIAKLSDPAAELVEAPLLSWNNPVINAHGAFPKSGEPLPGPIILQASPGVRFANIQVQPLAKIDHATFINQWDEQSLARGRKIYSGLCITCHGNQEIDGSLPTSRKFWEAEFLNGADPRSMFKTLTEGFGQMPPQPWMTPEMAYDVIHYIREELVRPTNPNAYFPVTENYLAGLPKSLGTTLAKTEAMRQFEEGPQYLRMDFGPVLNWTYEVAPGNIAYKGIAVRLGEGDGGISRGEGWMLYDHDTMRAAAGWSGDEFIDWRGIAFDGSHQTHSSIGNSPDFANPVGPGWANPKSGSFEDPRLRGRDGKPYGPLPREWAHYKGTYRNGGRIVIAYTVGDARVLESPGRETSGGIVAYSRTVNVGRSSRDLIMRVAPEDRSVALVGQPAVDLEQQNGFQVIRIAAANTPVRFKVLVSDCDPGLLYGFTLLSEPAEDLDKYTQGGPATWNQTVTTRAEPGPSAGPFATDILTTPHGDQNPWNSWMRLGGFDFFSDGDRAAVCTWMGDVWIVQGLDGALGELRWKRIAAGLFQPLGVKIVDEVMYITCRDQIVRLRDLNGDEEIDFYESFNNDHQVTEHFHEFAMGLQRDAEGNFYYAKSARHALPALVPHHGTLLKVTPDGASTEIIATGFRAANGVCLNPDGTFFVTDQEGHWTPKNRINKVRAGGFYGNMMAYHTPESSADSAMEDPLVWITNEMDRSPGELLWVRSESWGPLKGSLLNLSYGTGKIYLVPHETVNGQTQGGVVALPLPSFPTGVMRGRFHPGDGHLYACGMFAWAGNQQEAGGFYRVRYTGGPAHLPVGLRAETTGITITFTDPLDGAALVPENFQVKAWDLKRTSNYGSNHYNERSWKVASARLLKDGKTVQLTIPDIAPTWGMEITYTLAGPGGQQFSGRIHNTIHHLRTL